ncbi:MAG: GDP-mannose 4,6-dehydratase [Sphingomonadales bacterium]|nr:GDP-mannose 4,6-dehydratase [Sphingomonadaceae bacterium]MBS3930417.1 GDP-mannose 4,6-dehydratase [Sphingomonadales bacterium]
MRALITGANGFVGSHLIEHLISIGAEVHGTIRSFRSDLSNLAHIDPVTYTIHFCDITDEVAITDLVARLMPTHIFHLAAHSYVPTSWDAPHATIDANIKGTLNLLEAVRRSAPGARVQVAGSSEEYGRVEAHEVPIAESQPLRPLSPYGVSKVGAEMFALQYAASYNLHVIVTRSFNHTGPRRGKVFAESDWARQVALIEAGLQEPAIMHGNLDAIRDYTDVRDIVRGYVMAIDNGQTGEVYNLCSGSDASPTMRQVLDNLCALAHVNVTKVQDPKRMRPSDVARLVGNGMKARLAFGWEPSIPLARTLADLLQYWRSTLHATGSKIPEPA